MEDQYATRQPTDCDVAGHRLGFQFHGRTLDVEKRRTLIAASLAAYDYHTALLHWAHLDAEARTPGNGLTKETANALSNALEGHDEAMQLGVHLAAKLGLTRIYQIDDQLSLENLLQD